MQGVWNGVDGDMIERTASWLKSRRDGKGGFERNSKALDSFGRASKEVTDGYITYALTEAGFAVPGREGGAPFPTFEIHYNTDQSHGDIAEVVAAGWKQHLGIGVKLGALRGGREDEAAAASVGGPKR